MVCSELHFSTLAKDDEDEDEGIKQSAFGSLGKAQNAKLTFTVFMDERVESV